MNKRRLMRPWVQKGLTVETIFLFMFLCGLKDFAMCWQSFAIIFGALANLIINIYLLNEYGR